MQIIAHPFRLTGGRIATVEAGSDDAISQLIAVFVTTRRGERVLVPSFGVTDPAFGAVSTAEVNAGLAMFGPDVTVEGSRVVPVDASTSSLTLTWRANQEAQ